MNRITDALPLPLGIDRSDEPLKLELAELLDEAIAILRRELGEAVHDLDLKQTHWMRDRQEFRLCVRPTFDVRYLWQSWDKENVLDGLQSQVMFIRMDVERLKREGAMKP